MNESEKRGYKKVRITKDSCGWPVGTIVWLNEYDEAWDDECTEYWLHSIGYDCEYVDDTPHHPDTGTLAEIGAQVGDVVGWASEDGTYVVTETPREREAYHDRYQIRLDSGVYGLVDPGCGDFRIISRASDAPKGPVVTETVTRKVIVPGVYGKVVVDHEGGIRMDTTTSRADLIAARDVFNQLIGAMGK